MSTFGAAQVTALCLGVFAILKAFDRGFRR